MEIDKLDAHDRFSYLKEQGLNISECCLDLVKKAPFGNHPFYIFAHMRTEEDGFSKRLIWQPRLTKPKAQTNSMLFKAYPGTDMIKIIWLLPDRAMWPEYEAGKMMENHDVITSIANFTKARDDMEKPEEDDLSEEAISKIYESLSIEAQQKKLHSTLTGLK